jgi:hypothetical protein
VKAIEIDTRRVWNPVFGSTLRGVIKGIAGIAARSLHVEESGVIGSHDGHRAGCASIVWREGAA